MVFLYLRQICNRFQKISPTQMLATTSMVLLITSYGCVQKGQNEVRLEIKNVQSAGSNGVYKVAGNTNLPESSQIAITAVRYLSPGDVQAVARVNTDPNANRSILDRKIVEVKNGQWEADLNLWQIAPDGSYREVWQANQSQTKLAPESDVTFTVTFDQQTQPDRVQKSNSFGLQESQPQIQELEGKSLRFTNEGEKYVQASQSLSVPLPAGKTVPQPLQAEDVNDGWGRRYQILPETIASGSAPPPPTKTKQTNAPLTASEFLR